MSKSRHQVLSKSEADALIARFKTDVNKSAYVMAIDFEATCDSDRNKIPRHESEIIEVGGCLTYLKTGGQVPFGWFVKPQVHPTLSAFCTELTTITQADVDSAETFKVVIEKLRDIVETGDRCKEPMIWVSWGQYDFNQLNTDCKRAGIVSPLEGIPHYNLKEIEAAHAGRRQIGLNGAVAEHKLTWHGTHHRGVDDAVNVSNILLKLIKEI